MPTRTIYLVRHGQYEGAGHGGAEPDGELTDIGRQQAALTALRLRDVPVEVIRHSTLIRARQTAEIIAAEFPDVPLRESAVLRECIPCAPPVVPEAYREFFAVVPRSALVDGERRAQEAMSMLFRDPGEDDCQEIVVAHGNLISYLVSQAIGAPASSWLRTDMHHCAISEVAMGSRRGLVLVSHNETGHLPPELRTYL